MRSRYVFVSDRLREIDDFAVRDAIGIFKSTSKVRAEIWSESGSVPAQHWQRLPQGDQLLREASERLVAFIDPFPSVARKFRCPANSAKFTPSPLQRAAERIGFSRFRNDPSEGIA
jgi:hypothetical protein